MKRYVLLAIAGAFGAVAGSAHALSFTFYSTKASFDAATTTSVIEDFEGVPSASTNTPLAGFARNGVTYTPFAGSPFANVWIAGPPVDYTNFGADVPLVGSSQITSNVMVANGDEDIQADFVAPHFAIGFDSYFNGLGPWTVQVLGLGGVSLASFSTSDGNDPATGLADLGYFGVLSDTPLWGFRFTSTLGGRLNTGFDNIAVGDPRTPRDTSIPEPAAWSLMIAGFGLAGASLRRRRAAQA